MNINTCIEKSIKREFPELLVSVLEEDDLVLDLIVENFEPNSDLDRYVTLLVTLINECGNPEVEQPLMVSSLVDDKTQSIRFVVVHM